jgi:hypothetical protein
LAETTLLEEQSKIVAALKFFIYDSEGLAIICHREELTNLYINSMNHFLTAERTHINSGAQVEEDQMENAARGDSTPARSEFIEKKHINPQFVKYSVSSPSTHCSSQSPISNYSLS